jgi:hypothetical protein
MVGEAALTPAEERRRSEGLRWKLQKLQGLHCKQKFPIDPKLK